MQSVLVAALTWEVKTGPEVSVVVEADDNIMKYIEATVSGGTLRIRTEDFIIILMFI